MKKLNILVTLVVLTLAMIAVVPMGSSGFGSDRGPKIEVLRHEVIRSPDAALLAMTTGVADISPDQIRTADISTQVGAPHYMTATGDLGFHMGFIAYNIRDTATIQSYYRAGITYWPLHDVEFRHALIHSYDQLGIIPPIYGYIVTPVRSLVPPAQSKYYNTAIPEHAFAQGNPITSPSGEHTTCGILKAKGYTFVDTAPTGAVNDADYWKCPNGDPLPYMEIWTPLIGVAPTSFQHGAEFVADLATVGLAATTANGNAGLMNLGRDFNEYLTDVDYALFDAFMVFYGMGRIPGQLYSFLHTSQDARIYTGRNNAPGVNDPAIDTHTETIQYSLDLNAIEVAAKTVQDMLYTPDKTVYPNADNFALSYMLLYSRSYFNVFQDGVQGIVKSPGYGSDNSWSFFMMDWDSGSPHLREEDVDGDTDLETVLVYINGEDPDSLNPCYATTAYEWNIIGQVMDSLTAVNPYNHADIPWLADDWTITPTVGGMEIDFVINSTVEWQDGKPFTAYDGEFCLEFMRDHNVPRYAETWLTLVDAVASDATHLKVIADEAGIDLFYGYSGLAAYLPEHIWDRTWASDQAVLDYDPTEAYNVAPGYTAGPHPTPTNLFGTGPFVFRFYDAVNQYDDMWKNTNYFKTTAEIEAELVSMFWEVGDTDPVRSGLIDLNDQNAMSVSYGYTVGHPSYVADQDIVERPFIVDIKDLSMQGFHLGWYRTYGP